MPHLKNTFLTFHFLLSFLVITHISYAQNPVVAGAIRFDATFENIGIHYEIQNDDNLNSTLNIEFKESGTSNYKPAAMSMRAFPGMVVDGNSTTRNFHAGSALLLEPGTTYDIRCTLTDPDGGDLTTDHSVTTKTFPEPSNGSIKYVSPGNGGGSGTPSSPYLGLQAAANNAQPGDHFIVASGTYASFNLLTSGTANAPISFISDVIHGAIIDGNNTSAGIVTIGQFSSTIAYVIIDGFKIEDGTWGIDAQNSQFMTVRNNIIEDVDYGYVNRRDNGSEQDQYITNNLIIGNTAWPQSGIPSERGIDIRGNNNVVSYNTIKNFGDGVSTDGPPYEVSYSLDIHNNEIQNAVDDLIEVDGMISNSRVYNNRCFNGRAGISLAPVFGGPAYVFRNIFFNMEISAFKMNRGPSGLVIVHNTTVSDENASSSPNGWQNTFYRNNVMVGTRYCFELFGLVAGSTDDWDYDAYYSTRAGGSGTEWFKWNNVRYADVPTLQSSVILESNALEIVLSDFENIALPDPFPVEYNPSQRNFMPKSGAPVIDSGESLDNLNDTFVNDAMPDRGALEFGEVLPQYGHLFDFGTNAHIVTDNNCIQIFPNPFTDKVILDGDFTNYTIEIFDSAGQLVSDHTGASAPFEIDLTSLGPGMYFVKVANTNYTPLSVYKIIK